MRTKCKNKCSQQTKKLITRRRALQLARLNNLSSENKNTGISVVFKKKHELKCQNGLFLKYYFSGNASVYGFITEII